MASTPQHHRLLKQVGKVTDQWWSRLEDIATEALSLHDAAVITQAQLDDVMSVVEGAYNAKQWVEDAVKVR